MGCYVSHSALLSRSLFQLTIPPVIPFLNESHCSCGWKELLLYLRGLKVLMCWVWSLLRTNFDLRSYPFAEYRFKHGNSAQRTTRKWYHARISWNR